MNLLRNAILFYRATAILDIQNSKLCKYWEEEEEYIIPPQNFFYYLVTWIVVKTIQLESYLDDQMT